MRQTAAFLLTLILVLPSAGAKERPTTRSEIVPSTSKLTLAFPGQAGPANYEASGHFDGEGTKAYRFIFSDQKTLGRSVGEGIFPNSDTPKDPRFKELQQAHKLDGNQWNFADLRDSELGFYKWATVSEDPGVKWFMTAIMLERCGYIQEAVKGFYSVAVHFPKTISYTYYKTPWYVGPAALDRVKQLLRRHPDIKMQLKDSFIVVNNGFDNDTKNDEFIPHPGRLVKGRESYKPLDLSKMKVVKQVGGPTVVLKKYENGHWQLFVDGKPFAIRALTYSVTPVGRSPDRGNWNVSQDWQTIDTNNNGLHDGFFESWVDKNGNGKQDPDEPIVGDAQLLKDLGVNTLRAYHHIVNKELFRKLYKDYGIYVLCGDLLGVYAVGSGASWDKGTDYTDATQRKTMLESVRKMVEDTKDEPYVLMWVLGNENIYGVANNSPKEPEAFYSLINEAAELIHQLDPTRPVAIANGDILHLDMIRDKCPALDVIGVNAYRGEQGFGEHLFRSIKATTDRPMLVTEYGASAYADGYTKDEAEAYQAMYLGNNWEDLKANMAGRGVGNALGGVLFEYMDEWWKANSDLPESVQHERPDWYAKRSDTYKHLQPENHDTVPQFGFPFLDGWSYEEWFGLVSQGDGKGSPFIRVLRPSYETMKQVFHEK